MAFSGVLHTQATSFIKLATHTFDIEPSLTPLHKGLAEQDIPILRPLALADEHLAVLKVDVGERDVALRMRPCKPCSAGPSQATCSSQDGYGIPRIQVLDVTSNGLP
jgi:hypothetical protein